MVKTCINTFLFFSLSISSLVAQTSHADSSVYDSAVQHIISLYNKTLRENTHLYNGSEYIEDHPGVVGNPFWKTELPQMGSIYYDGVFYQNISLAYDIVKEEVVIRNEQEVSIKLVFEKIGFFTLSDQLFIHITSDSIENAGFKSGLYNVIYNGAITVLAKRRKIAIRKLEPIDHYEFGEQDTYFIRKDEKYYAADSKTSLLNVLQDKKEEIKKFLQKNKLDFKRDLENSIIKTADYYSQLKK